MNIRTLLIALTIVGLGACAEEGKYPISGEECHADDPVLELDASDCMVLPGSGTL